MKVMKMPNWAAAPKKIIDGFFSRGEKIDHGADGDEDEDREELVGDSGIEKDLEKSWFGFCADNGGYTGQDGRQVGEDRAKPDRQQQGWLVILGDGQVNQHTGDDKHSQRTQPVCCSKIDDSTEHFSKQLNHSRAPVPFKISVQYYSR